MHTNISI